MLEDIQIFQWCMNMKAPEDHLPGAFYCAIDNGSDRFKEE
ncbi:ATP phosphoribosyltransferase [Escherichia coli]|nr:ATP phosphoribosyltransferase [Escherichia coli]